MTIHKLVSLPGSIEILADGRMTVPNTCIYLGVGHVTLARMRKKGTGPSYIKFDRRIFYYKSDLDHWLESRKKRHQMD